MANTQQLGFVLPPQSTPSYPPQQHGGYPSQQANYPPQHGGGQYPPAYTHQPFPVPIQQQPGFGGQSNHGGGVQQWYANTGFQDYLRNSSSFHVKQKVELLEAIVGWETPNKYTVKDQGGNKVFYVGEESGLCPRLLCSTARPFTLTVKDMRGLDVLKFDRPFDCGCCFGLCCPGILTVSTPSGQKIGTVEEECSLLYPMYSLKDAGGNTRLKITGPLCPTAFNCAGVVFRVTTPDDISVGTISKEWSGFVRELFTDADYFSMSFPPDLDISMKAVCLGALFLIDYQYFERGSDGNQGGRRLFA